MSLEDKIVALAETIGTDIKELTMRTEKAKAKQIEVEENAATPAGTLQELIETRQILPAATTTLDGAMSKEDKAKLQALPTNSGLTTTLAGKVDKVAGKGLSSNDYSNADKSKLASLESSHFRGVYVNEAALATIPSPVAGDYADVDAGAGSDAKRWIFDASDSKWIIQESTSSVTASQVKQLYESNSDTNAFTDTEKTKLSALPSNQTLTTQLGAKADKTTQVVAGTGLTGGGTLAANRTLSVTYGTTEGTAAQGNDSRLSNSREWTASAVSQAEAEAGTSTTARKWTAQRVAQAISALGLKIGTTASTAKAGNWMPTWANVTGKPTTFTPSSHTHSLSEVSDAGDLAALNTNASTTNFLRGDGTWTTPPNTNTTYTEITTAEIDAGTASTLRTITGRRMKHALDKKANSSHTHTWSQVTGAPAQATRWPAWSEVTSKPATFAPVRSTDKVEGGVKSRINTTTKVLYMTNNGTNA